MALVWLEQLTASIHGLVYMHQLILRACFAVLVPIAKAMLKRGIGCRQFLQVTKAAFISAAIEDYGVRGRPTNTSRLSIVTGLSKRDVHVIRKEIDDLKYDRRADLSSLSDVLHGWYTDSRFADESGQPKQLNPAGENSFDSLVSEYAPRSAIETVRIELLESGALVATPEGKLAATRRYVVPDDSDKKLITALSFGMYALASTVAFNTDPSRRGEGRIERFVESNPAPLEKREQLRGRLRDRISGFTESIDNLFAVETAPNNDGRIRLGVGVFYFEDNE